MNKVYKPKEVAMMFKVNVYTVYQWLNNGSLKGFRLTTHWRIPEESLTRFKKLKLGVK